MKLAGPARRVFLAVLTVAVAIVVGLGLVEGLKPTPWLSDWTSYFS